MNAARLLSLIGSALAATAIVALAGAHPAELSNPVLSYYPPEALATGVSGSATLLCTRNNLGAFTDCSLLNETPGGKGFGAAALALAAKSADGCGAPLPTPQKPRKPQVIRFTFDARRATIEPDPRRPGWIFTVPKWKRPTGNTTLDFYPDQAARDHISGDAVVQCVAAADGRMVDCAAIYETPPGHDFGKAAIAIATHFAVDPTMCNGHVAGVVAIIPTNFRPGGSR